MKGVLFHIRAYKRFHVAKIVAFRSDSLKRNQYGGLPPYVFSMDCIQVRKLLPRLSVSSKCLVKSSYKENVYLNFFSGVLSIAWCPYDADLLLSCGKDNRILCWNPNASVQGGEVLYEMPLSSQWSFDVQWCPRNPSVISSCAFDGHVRYFFRGIALPAASLLC